MSEGVGRIARQRGVGFFAKVKVRIAEGPSGVAVACEGNDAWKRGAIVGARHALADRAAAVVIIEIIGSPVDTNPSIVAAAAAHAVWNALGVAGPADAVQRLEELAFTSWTRPFDSVPEL